MRTPDATPIPSLVEERTVEVRFLRPSRVVGLREARGWPARLLAEAEAEAYAVDALGADELVSAVATGTEDARSMRVEAAGCSAVDPLVGPRDDLLVPLHDALDLLAPEELTAGPVPASRRALIVRYRLPPGVGPLRVPDDERRAIGPIRWTVTWTDTPGELVAHAVCEVRAGALGLLERRKVRAWADRVRAGARLTLVLRPFQLADRDLAASVAGLDRLVADHPGEPAYHGIRALLRARLGHREAALRGLDAAEIDPGARAYWRGQVLLHEALGRQRVRGVDRDGAVEALQAAVAAGFPEAEFHLAGALTLGASGFPFGPGARLEEAAAELLAREYLGPMELDLLETLVRLGRHEEAVARVEQEAPHLDGEGAFLLALAATRGVDTTIDAAQARFDGPKERLRALGKAGTLAFGLRAYALGEALLDAGAAAVDQPPELVRGVLGRPAPRASLGLEEGHPALLLGDLLRAWLDRDEAALARLRSAHAGDVGALFGPLRREADERGVVFLVDLAHGGAEVLEVVPGVGAVVRARLLMTDFDAWLTWENGWRYLGCDATAGDLAEEALRRLDAGDLPAAGAWVRWLVEAHEGVGWTRHGRRPRPLVDRLLRPGAAEEAGPEPRSAAGLAWREMRVDDAAQLRAVAETFAMDATRRLPDLRGLPPALEARLLEVLEGHLFDLGRRQDALATIDRLLALVPPTRARRAFRASVRHGLGEGEALAELDALAEEAPDDFDVAMRRMFAHARLDHDAALDVARAVELPGDATASSVNNVACHLLFGDAADLGRARALCEDAWDPTDPHPRLANTRAVTRALQGDLLGALAAWREAVHAGDERFPLPDWHYVHGRLAEGLGLLEEARAAYARVPAPEAGSRRYDTRALADARLAALER